MRRSPSYEVSRHWVLAFDSSCGFCRSVSTRIKNAAEPRLDVLPLNHPLVRERLGSEAVRKPTLLRLSETKVRSWSGISMTFPLLRIIGLRPAAQAVRALGALRPLSQRKDGTPRRLPLPIAGMLVVAGIAGVANLMTSPESWARENKDRLPRTYADITAQPAPYRSAILNELPAHERSSLWIEHLNRYLSDHPAPSTELLELHERAVQLVGTTSIFETASDDAIESRLTALKEEAIRRLGPREARAMLATFGPRQEAGEQDVAAAPDCDCSQDDSYCPVNPCGPAVCDEASSGCGTLLRYPCDGLC